MRILIVKTSSLGDVVHMLPAITDAARMIPDLAVDWVVEEGFRAVPGWHPAVQSVIPVALRRWRKTLFSSRTIGAIAACRNSVRSTTYDAIIDSQGLLKSSLITHWARGKRYGYSASSAREPLASWAYDQRIEIPRQQHAIDRNRQITATALGYSCTELALEYGVADMFAGTSTRFHPGIELPEQYFVALHGTSRPDKEWPEGNWIQLARLMDEHSSPLLLPWGNQRERERATRIAEKTGALVLPKLDLDSLAWVIKRSRAVVGMDTGLMHIAAALAKPGVALYLTSSPALTGVMTGAGAPAIANLSGAQDLTTERVAEQLVMAD